jgi:hypothetical protein
MEIDYKRQEIVQGSQGTRPLFILLLEEPLLGLLMKQEQLDPDTTRQVVHRQTPSVVYDRPSIRLA